MNLHGDVEQGGGLSQEMPLLEPDPQIKALVSSAVKDCLGDITAGIAATLNQTSEEKLTSFKRQFVQESASSVKSALKKVKRDPHQFHKKSCEKQFRHQEEVLDKMEEAIEALERSDTGIAKEKLNQGISLVTNRMKIIKIADRSELWLGYCEREYEADDLAEDSETSVDYTDQKEERSQPCSKPGDQKGEVHTAVNRISTGFNSSLHRCSVRILSHK